MKATIIISILTVCLIGTIGWGVTTRNRVQVQERMISELEVTVTLREISLDKLRENYDQLSQDYSQSQKEVADLQLSTADLQRSIADLQRSIADLQRSIADLEYINEALAADVEAAKFTFYYASRAKQRYGVEDLAEYINRWRWIDETYVANRFDCSEMSAYLEWKVENEGYNTVIVAGDNPTGDGKHAWLLVETSEGKYMPVEATTYSIVYWSNRYFDNYFIYDYEFETIYEALDYSPSEFNWWE